MTRARAARARRRARPVWREADDGAVLVLYDVAPDKIRGRVHEACKDYGLVPIQYSAFLGALPRHKVAELHDRLVRELGTKGGTFLIAPICAKDVERFRTAGAPLGISHAPVLYVV